MRIKCAAILIGILCGCSLEQPAGPSRRAVLEARTQHVIHLGYEDLAAKAQALQDALRSLTESPTEKNLKIAQGSWKSLLRQWGFVQAFHYGPAKDKRLQRTMGLWRARNSSISRNINRKSPFTLEDIRLLGSTSRGLPALEVLLFSPDSLAHFQGPQARVHASYAENIAANILEVSLEIRNAWETHAEVFTEEESESFSLMVNHLVGTCELMRDKDLGTPLGKKIGGSTQPGKVSYQLSQGTAVLIQGKIAGIQAILTQGEPSILPLLNDELSRRLNEQLNASLSAATFSVPLSRLLESDPAQLENLYEELTTLLIILRSDLASNLGVTITFNDNDGD